MKRQDAHRQITRLKAPSIVLGSHHSSGSLLLQSGSLSLGRDSGQGIVPGISSAARDGKSGEGIDSGRGRRRRNDLGDSDLDSCCGLVSPNAPRIPQEVLEGGDLEQELILGGIGLEAAQKP